MKNLLFLLLLSPFLANAQINGTLQKTAATSIIRGSFGSLGIDTLPPVRLTGITNGMSLVYNSTTKKFHASLISASSIDTTATGLRTVANSRSLAQTQTALNLKQNVLSGTGIVRSTAGAITYEVSSALNTANAIVQRDANGDFNARSITLSGGLSGATTGAFSSTLTAGSFSATTGTFSGTVTAPTFIGALTGNASTVTTNANLTGIVTSVGNATSIADGAITNAKLSFSSLSIGSTNYSLGSGSTGLAGITSMSLVQNTGTTLLLGHNAFGVAQTITFPNATGTVALTSSNITGSAATLTTARTIFGQSFNGSANVSGALTGVTGITTTGGYTQSGTTANTFSGTATSSTANSATSFNANGATTGWNIGYRVSNSVGVGLYGVEDNVGGQLATGAGANAIVIATVGANSDLVLATNQVAGLVMNKSTRLVTLSNGIVVGAPIRLKGYTVATLPAGVQGDSAFVTDALAPTFMSTIVGGGSVVSRVFYNGTNWTSQ